jgi:hypothetical protein
MLILPRLIAVVAPLLIWRLAAVEMILRPEARDEEIFIVVNNEPTSGRAVLPPTESEFKFRLTETGDVVTFRWSQLEENERRRVQKLYGMEIKDDRKVFGRKISGVRFLLEGRKCVEGLRLPDRDQPGRKAIRTATMPLLLVPERDITSEERIECYESDFYSPMQIYERMLGENPPGKDDAAAHLEFARQAALMGLHLKALDHLEMGRIIDPRTADLYKEMRQQLKTENEREQAMKLYLRMLQSMRGEDFITALKTLESLDRNFPYTEIRSRWDTLRTEIEAGAHTQLCRKIVPLCYRVMRQTIQRKFYQRYKVDDDGNVVPCVPGKQVTTNAGHIFRGTLVSGGGPGNDLKLKTDEMTLTIRGKDIATVQDVDLSIGVAESTLGFEDMKRFICDLKSRDGLKQQMIAHVTRHMEVKESRVAAIFDRRREREGVYADGKMTKSPCYASQQDASYGLGSWLRDGARFVPYHKAAALMREPLQPRDPREKASADHTTVDDPEEWWKLMPVNDRLEILYAIAAEKVFHVTTLHQDECPTCAGEAVLNSEAEEGQTAKETRCPQCHGVGKFFRVSYE